MLHIDDLFKPRSEQVLLSRLTPLPWPHQNLRSSTFRAENHSSRFDGIPIQFRKKIDLATQNSGNINHRYCQNYFASSGSSGFFTDD
jgi:hypothetical protein